MIEQPQEHWRFTARPGQAEKVYLVVDSSVAPSRWIEMSPSDDEPGTWSTVAEISPGQTRLRYFTMQDGAYLNCGSVGLFAEQAEGVIPASHLAASA